MRGGSTLVAFEVDGDKPATFRFLNALQLIRINQQSRRRQEPGHASGDDHASAPDPAGARRARHHRWLVRFSAGLEHPDDVVDDIVTALKKV